MKKRTILTLLMIVSIVYAFPQFDYPEEQQKTNHFEEESVTNDTLLKYLSSWGKGVLSKSTIDGVKYDSVIDYTFSSPGDSIYSGKDIYGFDEEDNKIHITT
jgi:hypothetical protein